MTVDWQADPEPFEKPGFFRNTLSAVWCFLECQNIDHVGIISQVPLPSAELKLPTL
jgi:hypothetical protein